MSPKPFTPEHRTPCDVEGSEALCSHTGASAIFGLSSGEVIALTCTLRLDAIRKAVIYEPPFCLKQRIDSARVARFRWEVEKHEWLDAMTTAGEIVKLAPLPIRMLPRWLRKRFTSLLMKRLDGGDGYAPMGEPLPAMRSDFQIVGEMSQQMIPFSRLDKMVLLLGGTKIPNHLTLALKEPAATRFRT